MFPAMETLKANLANLSANDQRFANDLIATSKRRVLSMSQSQWVVKLAQRAEENAAKKMQALRTYDVTASDPTNTFAGVRRVFDNNVSRGAQRLAIRMETDAGVKLKVSLASDRKRLHFAEVSSDEQVEGRYFGYIDADGEFHQSGRTPRDEAAMQALRELDADPMEFAIAYGKRTGTCCVCGKHLTNKVSVAEGIGPVCSGRLA